MNLDANQGREAVRGKEQSNDTVGIRLNEAYSWLLVPTQEGTDPIVWEAARIPGSQETAVAKAVAKVRNAEVVQHLTSLASANVEVTIEIEARVSDGVPDDVVRTVTENCRTLRFTTQEFEEE